jgi:hypothetical protein
MNFTTPKGFFIATFTLFVLSVPQASPALDLIVEHNPTDPSHFTTIQAAIDYARGQLTGSPANNTTFRVVVKADTTLYKQCSHHWQRNKRNASWRICLDK